MLGAVADRILAARVDPRPVVRVVTDLQRLRDALLSHTDGAELVSASFAAGESGAMSSVVALRKAAVDAGVDSAHAELAARTVVYYVLGFTADEQSRLQWDAAGAELPDEQSVLADDPSASSRSGCGCLSTESPPNVSLRSTKRRILVHKLTFEEDRDCDHRRRRAAHRFHAASVERGVVRDQIKIPRRAAVYAVFSRDETVMGVGFPRRNGKQWWLPSPRIHAAAPVGDAIQLDSPSGSTRSISTSYASW